MPIEGEELQRRFEEDLGAGRRRLLGCHPKYMS